jgi:hypothetical protein
MLAVCPAIAAQDCERILSSNLPYVVKGSLRMHAGAADRVTPVSFEVRRSEHTAVVEMVGRGGEPTSVFWMHGPLVTERYETRTKRLVEYGYPAIQGTFTPGAQVRYIRVGFDHDEVISTEWASATVFEASTRRVGDCNIEVMEILTRITDKSHFRVFSQLYAPKLGYFIDSGWGGGLHLDITWTFTAASLELLP